MQTGREHARVGSVIAGKYELVSLIGSGGSSAVYEARHLKTDGRYAIKVLDAPPGSEEAKRMLREARALAKLTHPSIVRLIDFDEHDGSVFIVEELLRGKTLRATLDEALVLSPREALERLVPVLRALAYAHAQGVIHRDIKPENIVLSEEGDAIVPRLVDFGLVRELTADTALTRHNTLLGTPRYMSPEQAWGRFDVDARSDLWSFGAVLYECLAGVAPYEGDNEREVLAAIVSKDPVHLRSAAIAVDEALADAVMYALERAPEARCPSAAALEQRLSSVAAFSGQPWFEALFERARGKPASVPDEPSRAPSSDRESSSALKPHIEHAPSSSTVAPALDHEGEATRAETETTQDHAIVASPSLRGWLVAAVCAALVVTLAIAASVRESPVDRRDQRPALAVAQDASASIERDATVAVPVVSAEPDAATEDAQLFNSPDVSQSSALQTAARSSDATAEERPRARPRDASTVAPVYPRSAPDVSSHGANAAPIVNEL